MKTLTIEELEKLQKSVNPSTATHIFVIDLYKKFGYYETKEWIRQSLKFWHWNNYYDIKDYLEKTITKSEKFEPFKEFLIELIINNNYKELEIWVQRLNESGESKESILNILSELFVYIQYCEKTKNNENCYNNLADFLDRFTSWGKSFKILKNEPDL